MAKLKSCGIAWYNADTYERIKRMSSDADTFFDTLDSFVAHMDRELASSRFEGVRVVRIEIDPDELLAFCRDRKCDVNAKSRAMFVQHKGFQAFGMT